MTERKVKKHFRNTEKEFRKYFPLLTYNNAIGAYDFLCQKGYQKQVDHVRNVLRQIIVKDKDGNNLKPRATQPRDRRRLIVGLIFEKDLKDDFLKECWREEHAPFAYRKHKMEEWYKHYKYGYKSRYGHILENT